MLGFCRIDQVPDPANPGLTHGVLNVGTCFATGIFEPSDYQVETNGVNGSNGYVFVASTVGVTRLSFIVDPTNPAKTVIDAANAVVFFDAGSLFTNNVPIGRTAGRYQRQAGTRWKTLCHLRGRDRRLARAQSAFAHLYSGRQ